MATIRPLDKAPVDFRPTRHPQVPRAGVAFGSSVPGRAFGPALPGQVRRDLEAVGLIVGIVAILLGLVVGLGAITP